MNKKRITAFITANYVNTVNVTEMTSGNLGVGYNGRIVSIANISTRYVNISTSAPANPDIDFNLAFVLGSGDVKRLTANTLTQPEITVSTGKSVDCSLEVKEGTAFAMILSNNTGGGLTILAQMMITIELD